MSRYYDYYGLDDSNSLEHHGIKGQKWGNRRYQYEDGSLTPEGRQRYGVNADGTLSYHKGQSSVTRRVVNDFNKASDREFRQKYSVSKAEYAKRYRKYGGDPYMNSPYAKLGKKLSKNKGHTDNFQGTKDEGRELGRKKKGLTTKQKVGIGLAIAGTALAAYGAYKLYRTNVSAGKARTERILKGNGTIVDTEFWDPKAPTIINKAPSSVPSSTHSNSSSYSIRFNRNDGASSFGGSKPQSPRSPSSGSGKRLSDALGEAAKKSSDAINKSKSTFDTIDKMNNSNLKFKSNDTDFMKSIRSAAAEGGTEAADLERIIDELSRKR